MAVVKKFQSGGQTKKQDELSFEKFLDQELESGNFTAKGYRAAQTAAANFRDLHNSGALKEAYSYDPIYDKYTIDKSKLPSQFTNLDLNGSEVKRSLGRLALDSQSANSWAANMYNKFLETQNKNAASAEATETPKQQITRSIGNLGDYILRYHFKNSTNAFNAAFEDMDDDARKKAIMQYAGDYLKHYKGLAENKKDNEIFKNIDNEEALTKAISEGNWDNFKREAFTLGWNPKEFLNPQTQKSAEEATAEENEKIADFLRTHGVHDDNFIKNNIIGRNFTQFGSAADIPGADQAPWLEQYLKDKGVIILKDKLGRPTLVRGNSFFNETMMDPDDAEKYGSVIKLDEFGFSSFLPKKTEEWKKDYGSIFMDPLRGKYGWRGIQANIPGYENWQVQGWGGDNAKDALGNVDYTQHLTLRSPDAKQTIELLRGHDGKYYRMQDGILEKNEFGGVDIQNYLPNSFGEFTIDTNSGAYPKINGKANDMTLDDVSNFINNLEQDGNYNPKNNPNTVQAIIALKNIINDSTSIMERERALNLYSKLTADQQAGGLFNVDVVNRINQYYKDQFNKIKSQPEKRANTIYGGYDVSAYTIKKRQKGGQLTYADYSRLFPGAAAAQDTTKQKEPMRYLEGTLSTMNGWDTLSLVGTGVSFIPGFGAIGAGAAMGADLINDLKDGHIDHWGQHLLNLGFTGLSLIGLGGLKGIQAAAKIGKTADKAFDAGKVAANIARLGKTEAVSKAVITSAEDALKMAEKIGSTEDLLKLSGKLTTAGNLKKLSSAEKAAIKQLGFEIKPFKGGIGIQQGEKWVTKKVVAEAVDKAVNSANQIGSVNTLNNAQRAGKWVRELATKTKGNVGKAIQSKAFKTALAAPIAISTVPSAYNIGKNLIEGNADEIQVSDIKNLLMAGSLGRNWFKNAQTARAYKQFTTPKVEVGKPSLKVGKKTLGELEKEFTITGQKSKFNPIKKPLGKEEADAFKEELKAAGYKGDLDEAVKNYHSLKVEAAPETVTGYDLNEFDISTPGQDIKAFERAKKAFQEGFVSYGNPKRLAKHQKGGILKGATGFDSQLLYKVPTIPMVGNTMTNLDEVTVTGTNGATLTGKTAQGTLTNPNIKPDATKLELADMSGSMQNMLNTGHGTISEGFDWAGAMNRVGGFAKQIGSNIDPTDATNLAMYVNTMRYNNRAARAQKRAAVAGIVKAPLIPRQYIRADSPYSQFYEKQAARLGTLGHNLAKTTADIDKGFGARLNAEGKAMEMREKGRQADVQNIQQRLDMQTNSDRQTQLQNAQIIAANRAAIANAEKATHLVDSNLNLAKSNAFNNLATAWHRNLQVKDYAKTRKQFLDLATSPDYSENAKLYRDTKLKMETAKADWLKERESLKQAGAPVTDGPLTWEETNDYNTYTEKLKAIQESIDAFNTQMRNAQLGVQYGAPISGGYFASGGRLDLAGRKELARYRHELRRQQKYEDNFFKAILKNQELMQKSLIRVFK